jgi:hypothetical protein
LIALSRHARIWFVATLIAACVAAASAGSPSGQPPATAPACRVTGRVTSGRDPLPGASVVLHAGDAVRAATSSDIDGTFAILVPPDGSYRLSVELTGFAAADRVLAVGAVPCDTTADVQLALVPRAERPAAAAQTAAPARENGRGVRTLPGFQTLDVQANPGGEATLGFAAPEDSSDASRLLPAGFSLQGAQAEAVSISGSRDATSIDRGLINDRAQAIALGQFDPATGQFAPGAGPQAGQVGDGAFPQQGGFGGGRGGGGRGGPGGFILGGRGARGQSPYQGTVTYTFGGSALNAAPYQINPAVPATQPGFAQNTFGTTFGGPLKIPGLYKDENRRTSFQVNYTGNRSDNAFDQYATVPTAAMRSGDFSTSSLQLVNPFTGQPFPGNRIPTGMMNGASQYLMGFIPLPNLPGDQLNYHTSTISRSSSDSLSLRFTQNLSPTPPAQNGRGFGGGFGGGRGGFGGGRGGFGGRGGQRGTNIVLQGQLQYRRTENEALNVFPGLGSTVTNTSLTVPVSLTVAKNRTINNFSVNIAHSHNDVTNAFANAVNVGGQAGINYPSAASTDPANWGVPRLTLTGFTGVFGNPATSRSDTRITTSYTWSHIYTRNQLRMGADYRIDHSTGELNTNAPGAFTFTGLYSSGGVAVPTTVRNDAAFADFLLGIPQQAALQVGGVTQLHGRSFDAYVEDNWQQSAKLTFNLGLRYELLNPYTEANGLLANLDAAPGFTAVAPVQAGGVGPYTGQFPAALINTDTNNIGPRLGVAYRPVRGTVVRGGYSVTYNPGSYATIARRLAAQPPAAVTETVVAGLEPTLDIENALLASSSSTTNNWGVDKAYALGMIQTWNASVSRDLTPTWTILVGYTGVKGLDLDLLSAPNRGSGGTLSIADVQPFTWESSGGHSILNLGTFQVTRRLASGFAGSASYTISRSMDNTPSLGSSGTLVEQDPNNPGAEWALSNFDRRQQFTANFLVELPFGANRRWLDNGGLFAAVLGGWTATGVFTAQSGTPFTARLCGAATDIAQGTNCSLRGDYTGLPIQLADPTLTKFFDTAAFIAPPPGVFGDAARNMIIGPGGRQLNATLARDIRLTGTRVMTLQVNATNLLNTVQWTVLDTDINSPTYGHVISAKPMRAITLGMRFRF